MPLCGGNYYLNEMGLFVHDAYHMLQKGIFETIQLHIAQGVK